MEFELTTRNGNKYYYNAEFSLNNKAIAFMEKILTESGFVKVRLANSPYTPTNDDWLWHLRTSEVETFRRVS